MAQKTRRSSPSATTMSQRFTVSKSDGARRAADIQGEVNQLFEGDEPQTGGGAEEREEAEEEREEAGAAAGTEVVVVELKGKETLTADSSVC